MTVLTEPAPAKVNLALHVTGRRADGLHVLDSLVTFADCGDLLAAEPARELTLRITGPFAHGLGDGPENLVLQAARLLDAGDGAALRLDKRLPVASGLGGGSADAAAALRLLARLWRRPLPGAAAVLGLGADLPVCLAGRPARMRGVGERLSPVALPPFWLVLVNPGVPCPTGAVFAALTCRENPPLPDPPSFTRAADLFDYLARQRNDLEAAAVAAVPAVVETLDVLRADRACRLARMSGSGATCFGLYETEASADAAATTIRRARQEWWVRSAPAAHVAGGGA